MTQKAPGKRYGEGKTLAQIFRMFSDDQLAESWFADVRCSKGIHCPHRVRTNDQTVASTICFTDVEIIYTANDSGATQKTVGKPARSRLRKSFEENDRKFSGAVEAEETCSDSLEKNKHWDRNHHAARDAAGGKSVAASKERKTNWVTAKVVKTQNTTWFHQC